MGNKTKSHKTKQSPRHRSLDKFSNSIALNNSDRHPWHIFHFQNTYGEEAQLLNRVINGILNHQISDVTGEHLFSHIREKWNSSHYGLFFPNTCRVASLCMKTWPPGGQHIEGQNMMVLNVNLILKFSVKQLIEKWDHSGKNKGTIIQQKQGFSSWQPILLRYSLNISMTMYGIRNGRLFFFSPFNLCQKLRVFLSDTGDLGL